MRTISSPPPYVLCTFLRNRLTLPRKCETIASHVRRTARGMPEIRDLTGVSNSWKYHHGRIWMELGRGSFDTFSNDSLMGARKRDITNRAKILVDDETHDIITISNLALRGKTIFQAGIPSCKLITRVLLTRCIRETNKSARLMILTSSNKHD